MSLSVCFLTRNEEVNLPRAVRSVAGVADQVLVVDTASTDRTAEVATTLGAEVCQLAWDDDFGAARNFTVARATGDWILWMNADEELTPASHALVRSCMDRPGAFGYFVRLHNLMGADRPQEFSETADVRLFRRRPDLRFVGRAQPAFADELVAAIARAGQQVLPSDVVLLHHAYLTERSESKLRFNARLLERELQDRPGQLRYLIELGQTLLRLHDARGHVVLAEAVDQVVTARTAAKAPSWKVQSLLEYLLTAAPASSRVSRAEARELALRWFPNSPHLLYLVAEQSFQSGNYRQAAELLERLVAMGRTGSYERSRAFDPGLVGDDALMNLGACYWKLGELARAEACYRQLLGSRHFAAQAAQNLASVNRERLQAPSR